MEANIVYRITNGDERAFDLFMDHYSTSLYYYAVGITGSRESAEEVVSDVFFEVWKNRRTLLEIENMTSWLRTVTYRKAVSCLRHETGVPPRVPLDAVEHTRVSMVQPPDEAIISAEEVEELNNAIGSLPEKCRNVFMLAKVERIPYKEIASLMGISVATVNYHVGFAMDALRRRLCKKVAPPG